MPTTSEVGENICVISTSSRNAVRPGKRNRAVKYAAGTATTKTIAVEADATMSEVFSHARNRLSDRTSPKVENFHSRGKNDAGVVTTSLLVRNASSNITMYGLRKARVT